MRPREPRGDFVQNGVCWNYVRSRPVRTGQDWQGQVKTSQDWVRLVRTCQDGQKRSELVRTAQDCTGLVRIGHGWSCQDMNGQDRLKQAKPDQDMSGQVRERSSIKYLGKPADIILEHSLRTRKPSQNIGNKQSFLNFVRLCVNLFDFVQLTQLWMNFVLVKSKILL